MLLVTSDSRAEIFCIVNLLLFSCSAVFDSLVTTAHQAPLSFTISHSWLKFMSTESVMPSNQLILCHLLLLPPSIFPSIRLFYNESTLHIRWPRYWSFSFSIHPSSEYSGLISFRIDCLDLLGVQESLKSLLKDHSYIVTPQHTAYLEPWITGFLHKYVFPLLTFKTFVL